MKRFLAVIAISVLAVALSVSATQTITMKCDPKQLVPCLRPIMSGIPPPLICCSKLKEQKSCLCRYIKDPKFAKYVKAPGAKKVMKICNVHVRKCKKNVVPI
ncbi:hypothetical protein R6Q57_026441 [Mikania cordata]